MIKDRVWAIDERPHGRDAMVAAIEREWENLSVEEL
jgi:hypothetical protein